MSPTNYQMVLAKRPGANGVPHEDNFGCEECQYPSEPLTSPEVIIRTCYLSVDAVLRCLMNEESGVSYASAWVLGECIRGFCGVGVVVSSADHSLPVGQLVYNMQYWPWTLYFKTNATDSGLCKVPPAVKPTVMLHLLVGLTALLGIRVRGGIQPGHTCVVSGAAGGVGSLAIQIARLEGCTNIVGVCGSAAKCDWLTHELGATSAIDYKSAADIGESLREKCPHGIDVYFDNVGGVISDTVMEQMNEKSHVILCGQISQYNKDVPYPPPMKEHISKVIQEKAINRERFLILNYTEQFEGAVIELLEWISVGKLKVRESIHEGLENCGNALVSLMNGGNIGKQIVHVSDSVIEEA